MQGRSQDFWFVGGQISADVLDKTFRSEKEEPQQGSFH